MEPPTSLKRCLAIAMLRTIGLNQKDAARYTKCADQTVVKVEKWFAQEEYAKVARLCDAKDIEKMIAIEGVYWGLEPDNVYKLTRLTSDDILCHYREYEYMKALQEIEAKTKLKEEQMKANIVAIRHEAGLPLTYISKDGGIEF